MLLHDFQSRGRIERVVCPEIDRVLDELTRRRELSTFAADCRNAPEARLLAAARARERTKAAGPRQSVGVSQTALDACVAGVGSLRWADRTAYASLTDCPLAAAAPRPPEHAAQLCAEQDRREQDEAG